jgi:hypothetical protein
VPDTQKPVCFVVPFNTQPPHLHQQNSLAFD